MLASSVQNQFLKRHFYNGDPPSLPNDAKIANQFSIELRMRITKGRHKKRNEKKTMTVKRRGASICVTTHTRRRGHTFGSSKQKICIPCCTCRIVGILCIKIQKKKARHVINADCPQSAMHDMSNPRSFITLAGLSVRLLVNNKKMKKLLVAYAERLDFVRLDDARAATVSCLSIKSSVSRAGRARSKIKIGPTLAEFPLFLYFVIPIMKRVGRRWLSCLSPDMLLRLSPAGKWSSFRYVLLFSLIRPPCALFGIMRWERKHVLSLL